MRFMQGFGQITVGMIRYKPGCTRYLFMYYIYIHLETPEAKKSASGPRGKKSRRMSCVLPLVS